MDTATPVFDLLGHKIFHLLPIEDILKCRTICRKFKYVLDDPYLWLKLLKIMGHPEQCHKKWIDLIQKSNEVGIVKETFVDLLIQKTKNPYESFEYENWKKWVFSMPPIYNAVKIGNLSVVKAIAHFDIDFYKPLPSYSYCGEDWTAFTEAVENGHFEIAEFIESHIQTQTLDNETNLAMRQIRVAKMLRAIKGNKIEVVKFLSNHIKDPLNCRNTYDNGGPLHIAADFGRFEILKYFADMAGDNIHKITNDSGYNVISVAISDIRYDQQRGFMILDTLMKCDPDMATPLHHAAKMGLCSVFKSYEMYANVKDRNGETPMHYAASSSVEQWEVYPEHRGDGTKYSIGYFVLKSLIKMGSNPNAQNAKNQTPLHILIANSNISEILPQHQIQMISLLARLSKDLNVQDSQGWTPLHYAVSHYKRDMFEEVLNLIDPGSSVNLLDNEGMKPLDIALEDCNEHAVRILAPLTEDLNIAEETRKHPAYIGNEKFLACLQIIDQQRKERETLSNTNE